MRIIYADAHGSVLGKDQPSPNLSLLYLAGFIRKHLPNTEQHYISQKHPFSYHIDLLSESHTDIYAISFTSYSAKVSFNMIREIKAKFKNLTVVIGGSHVMTHAEQSLRETGADICAIGEGENTFLEIVKHYNELPNFLPKINGIAYLQNNVFFKTAPRNLIDDLDSIPFPARDLMNPDDFTGVSYSKSSKNTEIVITRGCPLRCVFCANPVFRVEGGPLFRTRTPKSVADEVDQLYNMGYREIYFHSDELNVRLGWSIELCKALAALNHKDMFFQCNMRVMPMNEELAYWMKKANFWLVRVGIESTSQRVLKGIKKRMSLEKTVRACELWSKEGIKVFGFLMMYNYWEENGKIEIETPEEINSTISFAYKLWRKGILDYTSWCTAMPVPGSELYDISVKYGFIDNIYLPSEEWKPYEHISSIDKKDFNKLYRKARLQTAIMAIRSGNIELQNWKSILNKVKVMAFGKPSNKADRGN
ncbi:MAG: B12-binding domain-containing radical SAM protein [Gammaproteobacteria bacterium]|nr:B12-binding domain-containing radical SAM protein [Gammaproteobacteria bacterium]